MPRHARRTSESGLYHVMLRGINRQPIFLDDADRDRFLSCLVETKRLSGCHVLAYCLMTNHVHLVLRTTSESVGQVVKRLGVRYARWVNRRYDRVGHLFQDRFLSLPVEDDAYLITLLRYVWNNPVEAGLVRAAEDYRWSSRHLLGRGDRIVDEAELRRFLPSSALAQLMDESAPPFRPPVWIPTPSRPLTDAATASLLLHGSGVSSMTEFRNLPHIDQRRAIATVVGRGGSTWQVARVTGLSQSAVQRRIGRWRRGDEPTQQNRPRESGESDSAEPSP